MKPCMTPRRRPGEARIGGCDDERGELVAVDVVADRGRAYRIVADCAQHRPMGERTMRSAITIRRTKYQIARKA